MICKKKQQQQIDKNVEFGNKLWNYKLEKKLEKKDFSVPEDICCETMSFYSKV